MPFGKHCHASEDTTGMEYKSMPDGGRIAAVLQTGLLEPKTLGVLSETIGTFYYHT